MLLCVAVLVCRYTGVLKKTWSAAVGAGLLAYHMRKSTTVQLRTHTHLFLPSGEQ